VEFVYNNKKIKEHKSRRVYKENKRGAKKAKKILIKAKKKTK